MSRAGILGGTFDPVHSGHVAVARQCRQQLGLDVVLLVPSAQPPHRPAPAAPAGQRLAMVELAVEAEVGLVADPIEVRRGGVSYAVDTLRELHRRDPEGQLVLLLGQDAALDFGTWHQPAEILSLAEVVVFNRAGHPPVGPALLLEAGLPPTTRLLAVDSPPVSATEVRARLRAGSDVEGMLAPAVAGYLAENRLYVGNK